MVLNAAVQMLREADELKQKILKFKSGTSMLQERSLWVTQQQLQKVYQKVLVLDLDYALEKKVEQDLWNVGFKQQIEALQAISKDRKNPLRSEGQAMLSWVLQAAAGFYLCLLHQICTAFKLDLPFRRRASLLGWVEGWGAGGEAGAGAGVPPPAAARYICQHCLVHLGDLARYRQQLRVAHTFYRHALVVSAHSGQPYNQLALVAWRRGRRLAALYWHVRSLLVRAPFPPAPANLARTLHAAASGGLSLPVLDGVGGAREAAAPAPAARLDAHAYVTELIRAMHMIHTVEQLDTAKAIVNSLNSSLTALIATDSFESMTLIKMACVLIWLVHSCTEDFKVDSGALSAGEAEAARLAEELVAAGVLALLLPAYTLDEPPQRALPALKVWLSWCVCWPRVVRGAAWRARPALAPALAHALTRLARRAPPAPPAPADTDTYECVPLPEDEELHGFLPLEEALRPLRFSHAAWDTYGGRVPAAPGPAPAPDRPVREVTAACLSSDPELERRVRAHRLVQLGRRLCPLMDEQLACTEVDGVVQFSAASAGGTEQLSACLAALAEGAGGGEGGGAGGGEGAASDDSDYEPAPPPPPIVISEADFREKVRDKRVGILKPQGSLERAREERAMASTQDDPDTDGGEDSSKSEDKKEPRKPRVNIAMAAIMRKQEETNKQVKFVTPPPTPDVAPETAESKEQEKPKVIQPKPLKGLAGLPLGRKTGGILSLKDKSAGYPHLVNTDPEPKKVEKEEKKEPKPQGSSQSSQGYQPKRQDVPTSPKWGPAYSEGPRMNFQKNYGIQTAGLAYNPSYAPPAVNGQGIRLPVVNPKEIDVRTAALQKQNSRQDLFQEGHKFGNYNYPMSGDKKNFLNDLPPRFANQYRYWRAERDDPAAAWPAPAPPAPAPAPPPWWKPDAYDQTQHSFYSAPPPYQPFAQMQGQGGQQNKDAMMNAPGYMQSGIGQPQLQNLQSMVSSPNFNSSLGGFGNYAPVGYDSAMYPQFGKPAALQPPKQYQGKDLLDVGLGFGHGADQRSVGAKFNDPLGGDGGAMGGLDQSSGTPLGGAGAGSTYSLFSGAPDAAWSPHHPPPHQSLWSGPGPSPLERLLEQQKQLKPQ